MQNKFYIKMGLSKIFFADSIAMLLAMGRGKGFNLYITGPANFGKTFILDPLRVIYKTFISPATCSYAWLGVEEIEVIFLNDFSYTPAILPWNDMLLLLESRVVHFAAPKTSYARSRYRIYMRHASSCYIEIFHSVHQRLSYC